MPIRERRSDRAAGRSRQIVVRVGDDIRIARQAAGLSLRAAAGAVSLSYSVLGRIERGLNPNVTVRDLCRASAAVGLEFSGRTYPAGDPVRDVGQQDLLRRLRARVPSTVPWSTEVALPISGDRRAFDAVARLGGVPVGIEAETRLSDVQATLRRLTLKQRDGGLAVLILVVADTRHNRRIVRVHDAALRAAFPLGPRSVLHALSRGRAPGQNGFVLL